MMEPWAEPATVTATPPSGRRAPLPLGERARVRSLDGRAPATRAGSPQVTDELLRAPHDAGGEEQDHADEEAAQDQEPEIGVARREGALEPAHPDGSDHRPHEGAAPTHRHPDDHLDGRQHADL